MSRFNYEQRLAIIERKLPPTVLVPEGLEWNVREFIEGSLKIPHEESKIFVGLGFLSQVGPNYSRSEIVSVSAGHLLAYLMRGAHDPCRCESARKYKFCHAPEDLDKLEATLLELNS